MLDCHTPAGCTPTGCAFTGYFPTDCFSPKCSTVIVFLMTHGTLDAQRVSHPPREAQPLIDLGLPLESLGNIEAVSSWMTPGTTLMTPAAPSTIPISQNPSHVIVPITQHAPPIVVPPVAPPQMVPQQIPQAVPAVTMVHSNLPVQVVHSTPVQANDTRVSPSYTSQCNDPTESSSRVRSRRVFDIF